MAPLAVADAVHGVIGGVTDNEAQLAVGSETDPMTDVAVASSGGAAAISDVAKWTCCISDRSRFFMTST